MFGIIAQKAVRMIFVLNASLGFPDLSRDCFSPKCKPREICRQGNSSVWEDT